jgi:hypothetical protein
MRERRLNRLGENYEILKRGVLEATAGVISRFTSASYELPEIYIFFRAEGHDHESADYRPVAFRGQAVCMVFLFPLWPSPDLAHFQKTMTAISVDVVL